MRCSDCALFCIFVSLYNLTFDLQILILSVATSYGTNSRNNLAEAKDGLSMI